VKCCKIFAPFTDDEQNETNYFMCKDLKHQAIKDRHFFSKIFLFPKIQSSQRDEDLDVMQSQLVLDSIM
jgi:hypothetical protein